MAGSIGPYVCCIEGVGPFDVTRMGDISDEEYEAYHRIRFETFADDTNVDLLAIET